jgi:hypothetical protein
LPNEGAENVTDDNKTTEERKLYFTRVGKDVGFIEKVVRMSDVYLHGTHYGGKKGLVIWWNIYKKMHPKLFLHQ